MGRGGYRENAGRKSSWPSGRSIDQTKLIRVPTEFASQLLDIARKLDAGEAIDLDTKSNNDSVTESKDSIVLSQVTKVVDSWQQKANEASQKSSQWIKARTLLNQLGNVLAKTDGRIDNETVTESKNEQEFVVISKGLVAVNELVTDSNKETAIEVVNCNEEPEKEESDFVTESSDGVLEEVNGLIYQAASQLELLDVSVSDKFENLVDSELKPMTGRELARRLGVNSGQITRHRNGDRKPNIIEWSKRKDPDGVAWQYSEDLKKYVPVLSN